MIQRDLASNLIPVSLLILACVAILWCASANPIWLGRRASNDLPLITPSPQQILLKVLLPAALSTAARRLNLSGPLRKTGRPGVMARAGGKIRLVGVVCARTSVGWRVCVCCVPREGIWPAWAYLHQSRVGSGSKAWDQHAIVTAGCHWHVLGDIITTQGP